MVAFATQTDLEARLGRTLTDAEVPRALALLDSASTRIRAYTKQKFDFVADEVIVLRGTAGEIRLPQRPVTAVSDVVVIGSYGAPDFPVLDWKWDEVDIIKLGAGTGIINLPEAWWDDYAYMGTYKVTYSHGYETVPEVIKECCITMVLRTLTNPSMAGGLASENVGIYSYRLDGSGTGLSVQLTDDDKTDLDTYRAKSYTSQVR